MDPESQLTINDGSAEESFFQFVNIIICDPEKSECADKEVIAEYLKTHSLIVGYQQNFFNESNFTEPITSKFIPNQLMTLMPDTFGAMRVNLSVN